MGFEEKFDAAKDKVSGKAKEAYGDLANDDQKKAEGQGEQARGEVKERVEDLKDGLSDAVDGIKDAFKKK